MMPNPTLALLIFSIAVLVQPQSQTCPKTTSPPYRCTYYYSSPSPNCTDPLTFSSCEYPSQCLQIASNATCFNQTRLTSTNQSLCQDKCPSTVDPIPLPIQQPNNTAFIIVGIICAVILLLIICSCLLRRCCCMNRPPRRVVVYEVQLIEMPQESERHFTEWQSTGSHEEWIPCHSGDESKQEICVICLDEKRQAFLRCDHGFHKRCIREWLSLKRNCPTCKNEQIGPIRLICLECRQVELLCSKAQLSLLTLPDRCPTCKVQR